MSAGCYQTPKNQIIEYLKTNYQTPNTELSNTPKPNCQIPKTIIKYPEQSLDTNMLLSQFYKATYNTKFPIKGLCSASCMVHCIGEMIRLASRLRGGA